MNHCLAMGEGLFHFLLYDRFISCMLHQCDGLTTLGFSGYLVFLTEGGSVTRIWTPCNSETTY